MGLPLRSPEFAKMATSTRIPFFVLAFAFLLGVALATPTLDELETIQFSYSGSKGPSNWGNLSPHFSTCAIGKIQSPVNIVRDQTVVNKNLKALTRNYNPAKATLVNNGFNIGMHYEENVGVLTLNGKNYTLKQMHWHSPSEHQIDGVQFPAELHLVHIANDGSISVVAILYQYGDVDPLVYKIKNSLDKLAKEVCAGHEEAQIPVGTIDVKPIRRSTRKYFRYIGSLTTPPCTENVIWTVLGKVRTISKEQVAALKSPLHSEYQNNSRPVQPLNGRRVELYDELSKN